MTSAASPAAQVSSDRVRRPLPARALASFALATVASLAFAGLAVAVTAGHTNAFDRAWALAIHRIDHDVIDWIMIGLSLVGSTAGVWAIVLMIGGVALRRGQWRLALVLAIDTGLAALVTYLLKIWFARPRPTLFSEITRPTSWSFPSGHALMAVAVLGAATAALIALYPQRKRALVIGAIPFIVCIGVSRVYLGVHWPTDVIAGFFAGTPLLVATTFVIHELQRARGSQHVD